MKGTKKQLQEHIKELEKRLRFLEKRRKEQADHIQKIESESAREVSKLKEKNESFQRTIVELRAGENWYQKYYDAKERIDELEKLFRDGPPESERRIRDLEKALANAMIERNN